MQNTFKITTLLLPLLLLVGIFTPVGGTTLPGKEPIDIGADVSCGKCGMYPAKYPDWQTQVIFTDGKMVPFDGCKCMFGYLMNMAQYDPHHSAQDVAAIWVRDHNTGEWINARDAHFVVGSDVMGPMGKELIPFGTSAAAENFQQEHGGELAGYDAITMDTLKPLMGNMHMQKNRKDHMEM